MAIGIISSPRAYPAGQSWKILYWAGINLDIQHRKEAERQLQQLVETLESRVSERTLQLENATVKLRELTGTLLQTQDEERRRIARELHDGAGQLVVAMSMNFANILREKEKLSAPARQTAERTQALIEQASREIRTMSHLLHPPLLDEVGLDSALRWYVDGFSERSKIPWRRNWRAASRTICRAIWRCQLPIVRIAH
jgi:signal transduction histidine kinase